jgi:hypothetical protein
MTDKGIALVDGADGLTRIVEAFVARLREQVDLDAQRRGEGAAIASSTRCVTPATSSAARPEGTETR